MGKGVDYIDAQLGKEIVVDNTETVLQPALELEAGAGVTLTTTNDTVNKRTKVSIAASVSDQLFGKLVSELRATTGTDGQIRHLKGYTTSGDGAEGLFRWSTTAAVDDGGTILNAGGLGASGAGWRRIYDGALNAKWFGATGNGTTDDRASLQRWIAAKEVSTVKTQELFLPRGRYRCVGALELAGKPFILQGEGWRLAWPITFGHADWAGLGAIGSIIAFEGSNGLEITSVSGGENGYVIEDIGVVGDGAVCPYGISCPQSGASTVVRMHMRRVLIGNWEIGLDPGRAEISSFDQITVSGCSVAGIRISDALTTIVPTTLQFYDTRVESCTIAIDLGPSFGCWFNGGLIQNNTNGILIHGCTENWVRDFYGENNTNYDVCFDSSSEALDRVTVEASRFQDGANAVKFVTDQTASEVWQVAAGGPTFVNETTDFNDVGDNDFQPFPTGAVTDYCAFGFTKKFNALVFDYANGTVGTVGVVAWEYWNGSTWAALGVTDGTNSFKSSAADALQVSFSAPGDWAATSLNSGASLYYVRARVTTGYTVNPILDQGYATGRASGITLRDLQTSATVVMPAGQRVTDFISDRSRFASLDTSAMLQTNVCIVPVTGVSQVARLPSLNAASYVGVGASPAGTGAVRLTYGDFVVEKNSGGTDKRLVGISSDIFYLNPDNLATSLYYASSQIQLVTPFVNLNGWVAIVSGSAIFYQPDIVWDQTVAAPKLWQATIGTGNGQDLTITAQATSAGSGNGGHLLLQGGAKGAGGVDGSVKLRNGQGTLLFEVADSSKLAFYGVTPVVRSAAYTQSYATASRTHAAYTPDSESSAYTGAADGEAKLADLNALRVAYENLRVAYESTAQVLNQVLDDLQANGLLQ